MQTEKELKIVSDWVYIMKACLRQRKIILGIEIDFEKIIIMGNRVN